MRDDYLNQLDAGIRLQHAKSLERHGLVADEMNQAALTGLLTARRIYAGGSLEEALAQALTGPLLTGGPRLRTDIYLQANRDHPGNVDLLSSRAQYIDRIEFTITDLVYLGTVIRKGIVNGEITQQERITKRRGYSGE